MSTHLVIFTSSTVYVFEFRPSGITIVARETLSFHFFRLGKFLWKTWWYLFLVIFFFFFTWLSLSEMQFVFLLDSVNFCFMSSSPLMAICRSSFLSNRYYMFLITSSFSWRDFCSLEMLWLPGVFISDVAGSRISGCHKMAKVSYFPCLVIFFQTWSPCVPLLLLLTYSFTLLGIFIWSRLILNECRQYCYFRCQKLWKRCWCID